MLWSPHIICHPTIQFYLILPLKCCFLITMDILFSFSSIIFSIVTFTMWEMSSRRVNSLKLMVRCRRAVRWEISFILLRLLPWRFSTWKCNTLKIVYCERMTRLQNQAVFWKSQSTDSDLTEDIGSGHIEQNFVIQAQQLGLWFQHRFHVQDFLV